MIDWITNIFATLGTTDLYTVLTGREAPCVGADCAQYVTQSTSGVREAVFGFVSEFFAWIINGLPPGGGLPQEFLNAAAAFGNAFQSFSFMFPTDVLAYCILLVIEVRFSIWVFRVLIRFVNWFRGVSTEDTGVDFTYYGAAWNR